MKNHTQKETLKKATEALYNIPADVPFNDWMKIGTALKTEFGEEGKQLFLTWSSQASGYKESETHSIWKCLKVGHYKIEFLYWYAINFHNYTPEKQKRPYSASERKKHAIKRQQEQQQRIAQQKAQDEADKKRAKAAINDILPVLTPADPHAHPYLINKQSNGVGAYILCTDDLPANSVARYTYPINEIANTKSRKTLIIPFQNAAGEYVGMQCIYGSKKRYLKGSIATGSYAYIADLIPTDDSSATFIIGEGYATTNSYQQALPDHIGVMAKDANNLPVVAQLIRERHPYASIVILADNDASGVGQKAATKAATLVNAPIAMPERIDKGKGTDWNDIHLQQGLDAIRTQAIAVEGNPITDISSIDTLRESKNYKDAYRKISAAKETGHLDYIVSVYHRYALEGVVAAIDLGITSIKLHQDMKAGKTFLVGWLQKHHPEINNTLYISHLASINESTTQRLSVEFDQKFTNYKALKQGDNPDGTGTTLNSAPVVVDKLNTTTFDLVTIDETEGVAPFIANGSINNKEQAGKTITEVTKNAKIVIVSDAHMGSNTDTFLNKFVPDRSFMTLKNDYQHWKGVKYSWIDNKNEGLDYLKQRLQENKPLFVYFTSAALAEYAYEMCKEQGLFGDREVLLASSSTAHHQSVIDAKANNSLFNQYPIVFASPLIGISLSIEGNYFHDALVFYSRHEKTGNSQSATQIPFRTRDVNNIVCVKVDHMDDHYCLAQEIKKIGIDANNQIEIERFLAKMAYQGNETARRLHNTLSDSHIYYQAQIAINDANDYQHYYENINAEFRRKGMIEVPKPVVQHTATIDEEMKQAKQRVRERAKQAVIDADDKTHDEIVALKVTASLAPESLSSDEQHAIEKYDLCENFISTKDLQTLEKEARIIALEEAWALKQQGVDRARRRIQAALMPARAINRICNTWIAGIGESRVMQKDIASDSAAHLKATTDVDRLLLNYLGLTENENGDYIMEDGVLLNNSVVRDEKQGKFTIKIKKLMHAFNAMTGTRIITKKKIKEQPARLLVDLLRQRFGLEVKKVRKPKKLIVRRQTVRTEACEFPQIAEIITKPLNLKPNGRMSAKNYVEINETLLEKTGFSATLTDDICEYYNNNKPEDMKKITHNQRDNHPVALFKRLAETLLGIRFNKIKAEDEWIIPTQQVVIDNLNLATHKGLNSLLNLDARISAELCLSDDGLMNDDVKKRLNMICSTEQHIKQCLKNIPVERHDTVIREYIDIASQSGKSGKRFTPLADANLYLLYESSSKTATMKPEKKSFLPPKNAVKNSNSHDSLPPFSASGFWWQDQGGKSTINRIVEPILH